MMKVFNEFTELKQISVEKIRRMLRFKHQQNLKFNLAFGLKGAFENLNRRNAMRADEDK